MNGIWIVDGEINLTTTGTSSNWHLATTIENLMAQGLSRRDAEAFANFIFNEYVTENGGRTDHRSEDCVDDAQYERLSVR